MLMLQQHSATTKWQVQNNESLSLATACGPHYVRRGVGAAGKGIYKHIMHTDAATLIQKVIHTPIQSRACQPQHTVAFTT